MTQEFLEDALSEVRDEFVAEAAEKDPIEAPKILPLKKRSQKAWVSIAAVLCVAALALPLRFFFGGMGSSADSADEMAESAEEPSSGEEQEAGDLPTEEMKQGSCPTGELRRLRTSRPLPSPSTTRRRRSGRKRPPTALLRTRRPLQRSRVTASSIIWRTRT